MEKKSGMEEKLKNDSVKIAAQLQQAEKQGRILAPAVAARMLSTWIDPSNANDPLQKNILETMRFIIANYRSNIDSEREILSAIANMTESERKVFIEGLIKGSDTVHSHLTSSKHNTNVITLLCSLTTQLHTEKEKVGSTFIWCGNKLAFLPEYDLSEPEPVVLHQFDPRPAPLQLNPQPVPENSSRRPSPGTK